MRIQRRSVYMTRLLKKEEFQAVTQVPSLYIKRLKTCIYLSVRYEYEPDLMVTLEHDLQIKDYENITRRLA